MRSLAIAAIVCMGLYSCKKETGNPPVTGNMPKLKTTSNTTLPQVQWAKHALAHVHNIYVKKDTVSATASTVNMKFKKDGTYIGQGSPEGDLGTFELWTDVAWEYAGKEVRRRDKNNNLILMRYFAINRDFDPGSGVYMLNIESKDHNVRAGTAVSKLNAAGQFVWAKTNGGYHKDGANRNGSISLDGAGNIYACGTGPGASMRNEQFSDFGFIQKADTDGHLLWEKRVTSQYPSSIVVDQTGYAII